MKMVIIFVILITLTMMIVCCPVAAQTYAITDDWRKLTPDTVVVRLLPPTDERQLDLSSGGRSETYVAVRLMPAHRSPTCAGCCLRLLDRVPICLEKVRWENEGVKTRFFTSRANFLANNGWKLKNGIVLESAVREFS